MPEIIGPDGKKYYTEDHFSGDGEKNTSTKKGVEMKLDGVIDYVYLIGGGLAILIGLFMLAEIAFGLILLFLGSTGVNYWMMKHR